jgi:hypothetical protein
MLIGIILTLSTDGFQTVYDVCIVGSMNNNFLLEDVPALTDAEQFPEESNVNINVEYDGVLV